MAKASPTEASVRPINPAELSYVGDEFWGHGGSYLLDPVTGKRSLIVESAAAPIQSPEPEA